MSFKIKVHQMPILSPGKTRVTALVTITNESQDSIGSGARKAAFVVGDVSGSMERHMGELIKAMEAWVDGVDDGVEFAAFTFSTGVTQVYPRPSLDGKAPRTATASAATRNEAKAAIRQIKNGGDTIMYLPISEVRSICSKLPGYISHCLFLTDGENNTKTDDLLKKEVNESKGKFQCDVRILGAGSSVPKMRDLIATPLLGQVKVISDVKSMAAEFRATVTSAMGKSAGDVILAIACPFKTTGIDSVTETVPNKITLEAKLDPADTNQRTWLYRTTPWNPGESRDYLIVAKVMALPNLPADKQQAMINTLTADGRELPEAAKPSIRYIENGAVETVAGNNIVIAWSSDEEKSRMYVAQNKESVMRLAFATNQTDLVEARQAVAEAARKGDIEDVTRAAKRAMAAAEKTGDSDLILEEKTRLAKVGVKVSEDKDADGTRRVVVRKVEKLEADSYDGETTKTKRFVQNK